MFCLAHPYTGTLVSTLAFSEVHDLELVFAELLVLLQVVTTPARLVLAVPIADHDSFVAPVGVFQESCPNVSNIVDFVCVDPSYTFWEGEEALQEDRAFVEGMVGHMIVDVVMDVCNRIMGFLFDLADQFFEGHDGRIKLTVQDETGMISEDDRKRIEDVLYGRKTVSGT